MKKPLGTDPFDAPKSGKLHLMSLDPAAAPAAALGTSSPKKPKAKPAGTPKRAPAKRRPTTPRPAPRTAPPAQEKPRPQGFDRMEADLSNRLQRSRSVELQPDQLARIDQLLAQIDTLHLSSDEKGLLRAFSRAWQWFRMFGRSTTVDDFGLDARFEEMVTPFFEFMYEKWWRVDTFGLENVPAEGRVLLVANHSGMLPWDGGMIKHAVRAHHPARREVRPLVEDFVYHFPFLGALMARIGGVRACQENAQRLLEKDEVVVVFPEGVKGIGKLYRQRYQLQRFGRGGFVKLCLRTGAPLIPVSVIGAEEIHPIVARADFLARPLKLPLVPITPTLPLFGPLGLIPLPTKWSIHFGRPIDLSRYGQAALDDELLINRITAEVRAQIQEQIYEQLKKRRSVFFG